MHSPLLIAIDILARVMGFIIALIAYRRSGRKSMLLGGISLFLVALYVLGLYRGNFYLMVLGLGVAVQVGVFAVMLLLSEENVGVRYLTPRLLLLSPLLSSLFSSATVFLSPESEIVRRVAAGYAFVFSGMAVILIGGLVWEALSRSYGNRARLFGGALIAAGISTVANSVLVGYRGLGTINELTSSVSSLAFGLLLIAGIYALSSAPKFIVVPKREGEIELKSGAFFSESLEGLEEKLKGHPVLAFLRRRKCHENWNCYLLTSVGGEKAIHPTDLYKLADFSARYSREAASAGAKPVVIIESPELLRVYNDFPSVVKALSSVEDYVVQSGGTLILITDTRAWDEREFNILQRVLELKRLEEAS